ncbi:MAG TPA: precorrin-6A reductase [Candidatus Faecousia intestinigallinarum]|nr:precorrin-6A reductase [Candidatus Faecousia intestinigallinarum]
MFKICVFGGTTEGRRLIAFLASQPVSVTACVATEYGEELLEPAENTTVSARRLPKDEIKAMFQEAKFDLVVDATHPYATSITESVAQACSETGTEYLRLLRDSGAVPEDAVYVESIAQAVEFLNAAKGNVLLTTGSKELSAYTAIRDFEQRVYVRILPMADSLAACHAAGVKPAHIIAMQGPFSLEMNRAMLHQVSAQYMVTKDCGSAGGFYEKVAAAQAAGVRLIIVGRPAQRTGIDLNTTIRTLCQRFHLMPKTDIAVVGIGPGSQNAMTMEVSAILQKADCLIGAKRMVDAVSRPGQAVSYAIAPEIIANFIREHQAYRRIAVVMSGDVGFFSGAKKLLPLLADHTVRVLPGLNSLVYLCAKLQTPYDDIVPVSLHGRSHDITGDVRANPRVFALVGGENGMRELCSRLTSSGLGTVKMYIGERLSYPDEKITVGEAGKLAGGTYDPLSVALIENAAASPVITHGLPDEVFHRSDKNDSVVPMTKSEIRSVCLSKLQLVRNAICWDVGAGTGSVAVEMALQATRGQVYAIEQKSNAIALLNKNKETFGLSNLSIIHGHAPESCEELPKPTHVFIGGSSGNMRSILSCVLEKNPHARIVATAISLESIAELTDSIKESAFDVREVVSLNVARSQTAGQYHLMRGQNPIYIFTLQRRGDSV